MRFIQNFLVKRMETAGSNLINLNEFIESRLPLIREDYFGRNKNISECIKYDMQLPEPAIERLSEMCK